MHKIITHNYDHRETPRAKDLKPCEKFAGKGHSDYQEGVDDGYCIWYFSKDCPQNIRDWCVDNKYTSAFALSNGIEFTCAEDFYTKVCEACREMLDYEDEDMPPASILMQPLEPTIRFGVEEEVPMIDESGPYPKLKRLI